MEKVTASSNKSQFQFKYNWKKDKNLYALLLKKNSFERYNILSTNQNDDRFSYFCFWYNKIS